MGIKGMVLALKGLILKLRRGGTLCRGRRAGIHPSVKIAVNRGGVLEIGTECVAAAQGLLLVERDATLTLGERVSLSRGVQLVCHERIKIGDGTMLGNNVMLFDHDHDFRCAGGLAARAYRSAPIIIGKNVWVGAGSIILRGAFIGDNAVIGAGCVVRGRVPANVVLVQKRIEKRYPIEIDMHSRREEEICPTLV